MVLIVLAIGWREGVVVLVIIPTTILLTLFASWLMGYTINRVSLFALIFSIGILVDDAIVVVENIVRHWAMRGERSLVETAIEAVAEVGNPTIVATLTIVAALLPMMFVSGMMGPYMSPIPANASMAMIFSFFVAVTVTPWLLLRIAGRRFETAQPSLDHGAHDVGAMGRFYARIARPLLKGRWRSQGLPCGVGVATHRRLRAVRDQGRARQTAAVRQQVRSPGGRRPAARRDAGRNRSRAHGRGRAAEGPAGADVDPGLSPAPRPLSTSTAWCATIICAKAPNSATSRSICVPKDERARASHAIALDIRHRLADLPAAGAHIGQSGRSAAGPAGPVDPARRNLWPRCGEPPRAGEPKFARLSRRSTSSSTSTTVSATPSERLRFSIDQEALEFHGVEEQAVYDTIGAIIGGAKVGYSQRGGGLKPIDITVAPPRSALSLNERILSTPLPAGGTVRQGANVELGDVVSLKQERASFPIFRHNGRFAEMVSAEVAGRFEAPIYGMLAVEDKIAARGLGRTRARRRSSITASPPTTPSRPCCGMANGKSPMSRSATWARPSWWRSSASICSSSRNSARSACRSSS